MPSIYTISLENCWSDRHVTRPDTGDAPVSYLHRLFPQPKAFLNRSAG